MSNTAFTIAKATEPPGIILLGSIAAKELINNGFVAFFINYEGVVELADPIELALDLFAESEALAHLTGRGYPDDRLVAYLKNRETRSKAFTKEIVTSPATPNPALQDL